MLPNSFYKVARATNIECSISLTRHDIDAGKEVSICHRGILMTWIPCRARYDGRLLFRFFLQHALPVSADMIDILLYLRFELVE